MWMGTQVPWHVNVESPCSVPIKKLDYILGAACLPVMILTTEIPHSNNYISNKTLTKFWQIKICCIIPQSHIKNYANEKKRQIPFKIPRDISKEYLPPGKGNMFPPV